MIQTITSFLKFLLRPTRNLDIKADGENQFKELMQLFVFVFAIVIFVVGPLVVLVGGNQLPNKLSELADLGFGNKWMQFAAMFGLAVIAAPLLEELIFRFPLKYRRGALMFGALFLGGIVLAIGRVSGFESKPSLIVAGIVALVSYIACMLISKNERHLDRMVNQLFPFLFYACAVLFAVAHIANYELPVDKWIIAPVLILPQFVLGLMLGYARIKYGILAAIFLHAINNLIPTILISVMPEGFM